MSRTHVGAYVTTAAHSLGTGVIIMDLEQDMFRVKFPRCEATLRISQFEGATPEEKAAAQAAGLVKPVPPKKVAT